jgi:hypothetical protein
MDCWGQRRRPTQRHPEERNSVTVTEKTYTVSVELSFPVSAAKAREVLEGWNAKKGKRKAYMRRYRSGVVQRVVSS